MLAATAVLVVSNNEKDCECYKVIQPQHPHQCQLCNRKISACLYTNELQHKITLQAYEINHLKKELRACELQIRNQSLDFQTLNTKYIAGIDTMAEIQYQKEQADREMEDLSTRLFEEANKMVANEKKMRIQLQTKLEMTEDQLVNERNQLRELKSQMEILLPSAVNVTSSTSTPFSVEYTSNHRNASSNAKLLTCQSRRMSTTVSNSSNDSKTITSKRRNTVASAILAISTPITSTFYANKQLAWTFDFEISQVKMFQSYLEQYSNTSNTGKRNKYRSSSYFESESESESEEGEKNKVQDILSIKNSKHSSYFYYTHSQIILPPVQQSEYIMQCEKEDIEPCLSFGNSESRMCVKVMMEYMLHKPCFIEYITLDIAKSIPSPINSISSAYYRPLWERWSVNSYYTLPSLNQNEENYLECASCGRKSNIKQQMGHKFYRFRLVEEDDWLLIDRSCRNRLVAVCNFYSFVRNVQLGLYQNRSFDDLYQENVQLRLRMFYSR
ncbi:hypothetical protein INT46_000710 [Mucor plumbeus]|uniref:GDP/GTP exchange factor Sec2 N-terminal domain-containing protein n=1 Tax=Mucor plumbeus TaxID=97098 RepID=A0A8H7QFE0_9FUNG|nr:hypothetical protein INT46_000710 [Mucor plumbeus]